MGRVMDHKLTWFVLGGVAMYFLYPYVRSMVPGGQQGS
jgi:hypothetical protein